MSKIHEIPIVIVGNANNKPVPEGPAYAVVYALLNEIETKLAELVSHGEESTIDLSLLKGMPHEFDVLRKTLGEGEVSATITNIGDSVVQETAVPCVWWVTHRDYDGSRKGEFIEIAEVPDLLRSDLLTVQKGLAELRIRTAQIDTPSPFSSMSPTLGN